MGSDMAECHPVAFRWVMKAKEKGAKLIHIDPRFTRTSAVSDIYVPIRAGSDITFLGGLINWVIQNEKYFKDYVLNYTNAATIINPNYRDSEDLDGIFSGYNPDTRTYDNATWQYDRTQAQQNARGADNAQAGSQPQQPNVGFDAAMAADTSQSFDPLVKALVPPREQRDPTLQNPSCAFQILKRHFARYTPEVVEQVCGCPQAKFLEVAQTLVDNSGTDRTGSMAYAVAWTQHTVGVQIIRAAGHPAAAARQHRSARRRHSGPARPREHSGQHRQSDAVPLDHRLHVAPVGAQTPRNAEGVPGHRDGAHVVLLQPAQVHGQLSQGVVR